jgi:hypothetical protein
LEKLSSNSEEERNNAITIWAKMDDHLDQVQIYECVKSNPGLAKQMQDRVKDDKFFELYLRVTAAAANDPAGAAKMVAMIDRAAISSDIGTEIIQCLPSTVATKMFMSTPYQGLSML